MIDKIIGFCIRERLLVFLFIVVCVCGGWYATGKVPIDAIPNVGENQVIVIADWPGRSPKDVEDQLTYPLSVALQTVPGSQSVRGKSMFGFSFVQVTFDDRTDFYWARSRVSERLTAISDSLPEGVTPRLAPDATALGQIFYYVLKGPADTDLAELRSLQDYHIKYALQSVPGVAEVASVGGYIRQYQVDIDPGKLRYHRLALDQVIQAIRDANIDVGAKVVDSGGMEFLVRGRGFLGGERTEQETIDQIGSTVVETRSGTPIRIRDLGWVQTGPALRTGALDLNGVEAVGGIVVMRFGENPRDVIDRVKQKIRSLEEQMDGIRIIGIYDRTELIRETVATLTDALIDETLITIAVTILFLLHVRSSIIIAITLPMAVLMSFIAMRVFGVDANIMSLAGIAIAIGTMVDMGIIVLENVYDDLAIWEKNGSPGGEQERIRVIWRGASSVGSAVVTAVSTTVVSFLPVFFLTGRDGKLFAPLAWTKTFALTASLIVAVVAVPMLCRVLLRSQRRNDTMSLISATGISMLVMGLAHFVWQLRLGHLTGLAHEVNTVLAGLAGFAAGWWISREKILPLHDNPATKVLLWLYSGRLKTALRFKKTMLAFPAMLILLGPAMWLGLPTVLRPVESVAAMIGADLSRIKVWQDFRDSWKGLRSSDWIALDEGSWFYMPSLYPAATFSQSIEILQKQDLLIARIPEVANVLGKIGRAESALDPAPSTMVETYVMLKPQSEWRPGKTSRDIWDEINRVATLPGVTPASALQPIEGRVVMLQAGIRATMAVRIYGQNLEDLAEASQTVAERLKTLPMVNAGTVSPDIVLGKPYIEFSVDREEAARYGMSTMMVNELVSAGLGGTDATITVEGRERYAVQVRFDRSTRERMNELGKVSVVTPAGDVVPLERIASIRTTWGPMAISSENARLAAHVPFMPSGSMGPIETADAVLKEAQQALAGKMPGTVLQTEMVGSFQNQLEANRRLLWIIPLVISINLLLHYLHFRNLPLSLVVFSGIPVSAGGGMIAAAWMGVEMNTAMWVGFIALFGLAADDGIVMATYIREVLRQRTISSISDIRQAIFDAGVKRIRPCVMTTITTLAALAPIMISDGRGADVARAMAIPVLGGMLVEPLATFVVPTLYCWFLEFKFRNGLPDEYLNTAESGGPVTSDARS